MGCEKEKAENFFDEFGLEVAHGDVDVGKTYPIFGMITRFIDEKPGEVVAEINFNIRAKMNISDEEHICTLKTRAFETGIFVSRVIAKEPSVEVECSTVIFGRQKEYNA